MRLRERESGGVMIGMMRVKLHEDIADNMHWFADFRYSKAWRPNTDRTCRHALFQAVSHRPLLQGQRPRRSFGPEGGRSVSTRSCCEYPIYQINSGHLGTSRDHGFGIGIVFWFPRITAHTDKNTLCVFLIPRALGLMRPPEALFGNCTGFTQNQTAKGQAVKQSQSDT